MKKVCWIALLCAAAVFFAGCSKAPEKKPEVTRDEVMAAFDKTGWKENAPTFGPVLRSQAMMIFDRDYDGYINGMASGNLDGMPAVANRFYAAIEKYLVRAGAMLKDPGVPQAKKNELQQRLPEIRKRAEELKAVKDNGRDYMKYSLDQERMILIGQQYKEMNDGVYRIVSETIDPDGKTGYCVSQRGEKRTKLYFVKEGDEWKSDDVKISEEGIAEFEKNTEQP